MVKFTIPLLLAVFLYGPPGKFGGTIISCFLNDPKTFNPLLANDADAHTLNQLTQSGLIRLNLLTQMPEPALAESWETSNDHLRWTFHLRHGLKWSDGSPLTTEDVIFTMQIVNDPSIPSAAQDALSVNRQTVKWRKIDDTTILAELPGIFASFLRKLDAATLPIVPKYKWQKEYAEGRFEQTMAPSMNPDDYVSAGPFTLKRYRSGQDLILRRNPYYWKKDHSGKSLPYLDSIAFLILPDLNQIELKLEAGEIDTFYSIRASDVRTLQEKGKSSQMQLFNVGPAYDREGIFFNQNGDINPQSGKPFLDPAKKAWFTDVHFRRAIAHAIDRQSLIRNAYFGMAVPATGPESISNKEWYNDHIHEYPHDLQKAIQLLESSGFVMKTNSSGKAMLFDKKGNEVRFSLYTNSGNTIRNTECLSVRSDLAKIGIQIDYSVIDFHALVTKITQTFDYDAILLGMSHDDLDPASGMNIWPSYGSSHFWWPRQKSPATPWEKRIDELMLLQGSTFDFRQRKQYYDEIQEILADQVPMVFTAHEIIWVCAKKNIGNLKPSLSRHRTLWNADELYWKTP